MYVLYYTIGTDLLSLRFESICLSNTNLLAWLWANGIILDDSNDATLSAGVSKIKYILYKMFESVTTPDTHDNASYYTVLPAREGTWMKSA